MRVCVVMPTLVFATISPKWSSLFSVGSVVVDCTKMSKPSRQWFYSFSYTHTHITFNNTTAFLLRTRHCKKRWWSLFKVLVAAASWRHFLSPYILFIIDCDLWIFTILFFPFVYNTAITNGATSPYLTNGNASRQQRERSTDSDQVNDLIRNLEYNLQNATTSPSSSSSAYK